MYPDTAEQLLEALTLAEANLPTYKSAVGASDEDIEENNHDRANLAQALANVAIADTDKQAVTQIKNAVYEGDTKESVGAYPPFAIAALPFPAVKAGADTRYRERRARFKAAKGYTKEIGIALGLEKPATGGISPNDLVAALKLSDLGSYQYSVEFKKQGQDAMLVQQRLKGTEKWSEAKTALTSPVTITVDEPAQEGSSVQIEVRGRLLDGNEQVGQWSPIYSLTVNP